MQNLSTAQRQALLELARATAPTRAAESPSPIEPVDRDGPLRLSFAQQRLWFLEQMGDVGAAYHLPAGLRLAGPLHREALVRALERIVARHEALRTTFPAVDGMPVQRIVPVAEARVPLVEHDLPASADPGAALRRVMAEEVAAPFDLARGPLVRARLVRRGDDDPLLLVTMHHIVSDGWSMGVFTRELTALYGAFRRGEPDPLPPLPVQYADYAAWQRRRVDGDRLREQAEYWKTALAGAPELLELPTDHPRPPRQDYAGASVPVELDARLAAGLADLSRRHGTTLFMTLLAAWAVVLGRLAGEHDVVVGSPVAGRGRREIEGLIGFFVNTLATRVDLSGAPTVAELLSRVKARALAGQQRQDIPFDQVVEALQPARTLAHHPLFQVTFAWQNTPRGGGGARSSPAAADAPRGEVAFAQVHAKLDLSLSLGERRGRIAGSLEYATALFARETVERWAGYLRRVLEQMVADPGRRIDRLALMAEDERARVVGAWNRTDDGSPPASPLHALFRAQAERAPGATALVFGDEEVSYAALDARADRLAHHLRALGVGPEARVAISVDRGPEMVAAVLAVLKAGGAYVPIDPAYPADRRAYMLADSAPVAILTEERLRGGFADAGTPVLALDADASAWADRPATAPEVDGLTPDHPAYVIYTSGSTGRPKGVLVPHRGLANVAAAQQRAFGVGPGDRVLQFASLSFDAAAFELVMALASGAALVLAPREALLPGPGLIDLMRRHAVSIVTLPPSALAALPVDELPALKTIAVAGEALPAELVGRWGARHRVWNLYGPTEATIWSTAAACADGERKPDIGLPIANVRAYVLDAAGEPVPVGVADELCVGGVGVARGYLGRPALTAERFVPDPFGGTAGARLYRTGDRVRRRADGRLDFTGRVDHQAKVRGYRIEPGEIEARLREHPRVDDAVVLVRRDAPGDPRLVAYVRGQGAGAEALRAHLEDTLPDYMVPAAYVRLDAWPLTPNGKLDRRALPAPEGDAYAGGGPEAPVGETERALAEIWAEVLGIERVGRHDDFFDLGGHSLLAVQVIASMREIDLHVEVQALFEAPTVAELARTLAPAPDDAHPAGADGEERRDARDRAIPIRPSGSRTPLFLVHDGPGSTAYARALHPHLDGDVPVYALPAPSPSPAPLRTVEGMAARLVRMIRDAQPAGPYRVAGWSVGGLLAYEVASQLLGEDEAVDFVAMFDTFHPAHPRMGLRDTAAEYRSLLLELRTADGADAAGPAPAEGGPADAADEADPELEAFVARWRETGALPAHVTRARVRATRDQRRRIARAVREYRPQALPVPVHQFAAADSPEPDPSRGWRAALPGASLLVATVPGTHASMMTAPNAGALGHALSRALDAPRPGGRAPDDDAPPLLKLQGGRAGEPPLFCVPGAGASVTSFIDLAGAVDRSWPVFGLQPRGMDGTTVPHTTVAAAAEYYLAALRDACPRGPVHLLGHSFGGWVAMEMALRLRAAGRTVGSLTVVDSEVPDGGEAPAEEYGGADAFLRLVRVLELTAERSLGIDPAEVDARDEDQRLQLLHGAMLRHGLLTRSSTHDVLYGPFRTFAACLRASYTPSGVYPDPLRLVLVPDPARDADASRAEFADVVRGWTRWAPGLVFSVGAGNHVTALKRPHVSTLAAFLAADRG